MLLLDLEIGVKNTFSEMYLWPSKHMAPGDSISHATSREWLSCPSLLG